MIANSFMKIVLPVLGLMYFVLLFYSLYKIAVFFFKAKAKEENRFFKGFYSEYSTSGLEKLEGIFPIPITFKTSKIEVTCLLKKRMIFVRLFWITFGSGLIFAFIIEYFL